jgi:pimeloyl-ACP methyl ester carboxylesterase
MTAKRVYLYHGNPGTPADWDLVAERLRARGWDPVAVDGDRLTSLEGEGWLVGYSWGAWCALDRLRASPQFRPRGVVLVAPFLESGERLGWIAALLLRVPGLGPALLRKKVPQLKTEFLEKNFDADARPRLTGPWLAELDRVSVWQTAVRRKLRQQGHGLPALTAWTVPFRVLTLQRDRVAPPSERIVRRLELLTSGGVKTREIPGASHGHLWANPESFAQELMKELEA